MQFWDVCLLGLWLDELCMYLLILWLFVLGVRLPHVVRVLRELTEAKVICAQRKFV